MPTRATHPYQGHADADPEGMDSVRSAGLEPAASASSRRPLCQLEYEHMEPPPGADPGNPRYERGSAAVRGGAPCPSIKSRVLHPYSSRRKEPWNLVEEAGIEPARQRLQGATATLAVTPKYRRAGRPAGEKHAHAMDISKNKAAIEARQGDRIRTCI